jgi:hypothetical protein
MALPLPGDPRLDIAGGMSAPVALRRLAIGSVQPGARHLDFQLAEAPQQRPPPVAVAVTADANRVLAIAAQRPHGASVARPRQSRFQLALEHGLDEFANPIAQASLDRIKPVVEKVSRRLGLGLRKLRLRGIACHGVVSSPALQRRMIRG